MEGTNLPHVPFLLNPLFLMTSDFSIKWAQVYTNWKAASEAEESMALN